MEKIFCLYSVGERTQKSDRKHRKWPWRQIKSVYRLYLDWVVKKIYYINCVNAWATNCATFINQKLCCDTVFLYKMVKRRTLQVCSLRYSIKRGMFSV